MTAATGKFVICSGNFERVSEQDVKNFKSKFGIYRAISRLTGIIMHNNKPNHSIKKTSETRGTRNKFVTTETIGKYPKSITLKGIETASAETSTARESRSFFTVKENNSFGVYKHDQAETHRKRKNKSLCKQIERIQRENDDNGKSQRIHTVFLFSEATR